MLFCLAVLLQCFGIGVTTKSPDDSHGSLPEEWGDTDTCDQYWFVLIKSGVCVAYHNGQPRVLRWDLSCTEGDVFGCALLETGDLHLYHNGRDVGVALEGLPTEQPIWGVVRLGGWKVEADYIIAGEAVW